MEIEKLEELIKQYEKDKNSLNNEQLQLIINYLLKDRDDAEEYINELRIIEEQGDK